MKNILFLLGITLLITFPACQNEDKIEILNTELEAEPLHGEIQFPVITKLVGIPIIYDSLLLIPVANHPDGICFLYSKATGRLKSALNRLGKGPGEFLSPSIRSVGNNIISLWDSNKKYSEVSIENNSDNEIQYKLVSRIDIDMLGGQFYRLNSDMLVFASDYEKGMFTLFNNKGQQIGNSFGDHPLRKSTQDYGRFQGPLAIANDRNLFVFGSFHLGYICAYEIEGNTPELKWEFHLQQEPYYTLEGNKSYS